jgi:hypothetical protein
MAQVNARVLTEAIGTAVSDTTVVLVVVMQPLAPVTVTEYGPAALVMILDVVAPVFHR